MIIDRTKNRFYNLLNLIHESNPDFPLNLTTTDLLFGQSETITLAPETGNRNTKVTISAQVGSGYSGVRDIYYNRCSLTEGNPVPLLNFQRLVGESEGALLERISAALNILTMDVTLTFISGTTWRVQTIANSWVYLPGASIDVSVSNQAVFDYRFEDFVNNTKVTNSSGGTNGLRLGSVPGYLVGAIGGSWDLKNGATTISTQMLLPGGPISFSCRAKLYRVNGRQAFFGDIAPGGANTGMRIQFGFINSAFEIVVGDGLGNLFTHNTQVHGVTANTLFDVGFSFSGNTLKVYKNGALLTTITTTLARSANPGVGTMHVAQGGGGYYPLGCNQMDRARFWNRELTAEEFAKEQTFAPIKDSRWDNAAKGANVALADSNRRANCTLGQSAKGMVYRSTGKRMFEVVVLQTSAPGLIGVGGTNSLVTLFPGATENTNPDSYGYYSNNGYAYAPETGASLGKAYGASYAVNDVIGVMVDFDLGTLRFAKNGVDQGVAFSSLAGKVLTPMVGSGSGSATIFGSVLNTGEDGFAFPMAGYTPWYYEQEIDAVLKSTSTMPVATVPGETTAAFKLRLASWLKVDPGKFKLGANADDVFTLPVEGSEDINIKFTSTDLSNVWATGQGVGVGTVKVRFPYLNIPDITTKLASSSGWVNDPTRGWYNNSLTWGTKVSLINLPTHAKSSLRKASAVFTSYADSPTSHLGENSVGIVSNKPTILFGTYNAGQSGLQYIYNEGSGVGTYSPIVNVPCSFTLPEDMVATDVYLSSTFYSGYSPCTRGFKNLRLEFRVKEI